MQPWALVWVILSLHSSPVWINVKQSTFRGVSRWLMWMWFLSRGRASSPSKSSVSLSLSLSHAQPQQMKLERYWKVGQVGFFTRFVICLNVVSLVGFLHSHAADCQLFLVGFDLQVSTPFFSFFLFRSRTFRFASNMMNHDDVVTQTSVKLVDWGSND